MASGKEYILGVSMEETISRRDESLVLFEGTIRRTMSSAN